MLKIAIDDSEDNLYNNISHYHHWRWKFQHIICLNIMHIHLERKNTCTNAFSPQNSFVKSFYNFKRRNRLITRRNKINSFTTFTHIITKHFNIQMTQMLKKITIMHSKQIKIKIMNKHTIFMTRNNMFSNHITQGVIFQIILTKSFKSFHTRTISNKTTRQQFRHNQHPFGFHIHAIFQYQASLRRHGAWCKASHHQTPHSNSSNLHHTRGQSE